MDQQQKLLGRLNQALADFKLSKLTSSLKRLLGQSQSFFDDMAEADKENLANIKCGLLSEDVVFEAIGDQFDLPAHLFEMETDMIKRH